MIDKNVLWKQISRNKTQIILVHYMHFFLEFSSYTIKYILNTVHSLILFRTIEAEYFYFIIV